MELLNFTLSLGSSSTVVNGSVFAGTALSATALELKTFPASTIVGKASAGITKGKPVIVEADGDFSPVVDTSVSTTLGTGASMANVATNQASLKSAYDYTNNIAYVMYPNSNSSNYPVVAEVIDPSASGASAITYGTPSVINSYSSGNLQNIIFDQASGNLVFTYNGGSNNMYGKTCTMSGSAGSISYSFGSSAIITGYNTYEGDAFYWKEQNRTVVSYNASSGANAALRTAIISGNSVTWTNSDYYNQSATTNTPNMFGVNSTYAIITYREGSNLKSQLMKLTNSSTGDFTFYSSQTVTSGQSASWYQKGGVINNTTGSLKVGLVYVLANGDLKGRVGSIDESANSITWGSEIDLITFSDAGIRASGETRNGLMNYWYQDNSATQEFIFTAVKNTADGKAVWVAIDTKDDTLALNQYQEFTPYNATTSGYGGAYNGATTVYYDVSQSKYMIGVNYTTSSSYSRNASTLQTLVVGYTAVNLTAENYIGIAQETVSTSEDVKVTTISGVDANQSSLTPAQIYYVQTDGTLYYRRKSFRCSRNSDSSNSITSIKIVGGGTWF